MSKPIIYTFDGITGDKHFWAKHLGFTSFRTFTARLRRHREDPIDYPLFKVYSPLKQKKSRDIPTKLSRYTEDANGCWVWKGNKTHDGYGRVRVKGVKRRAHIVSFEDANGPVPTGLIVCHKCGNRLCIRPDHLHAGTYKDNCADMVRHGTVRRVCGAQHPRSKLNEHDILAIRLSSDTTRTLAKVYGVGKSTIQQAKTGKTWKHVCKGDQP